MATASRCRNIPNPRRGVRTAYRVLWADGRAVCWFTTAAMARAWRRLIADKPFGEPVGPVRLMDVPKGHVILDHVPLWRG